MSDTDTNATINEEIKPIEVDFENIREERQKYNNKLVYDAIIKKDKIKLKQSCNEKELKRILNDENMTIDELLNSPNLNEFSVRLLSRTISKKSSRQSINDEELQLNICNLTALKFNMHIRQIPNDLLRPCKDGRILNKIEYENIKNEHMCLKSFDGIIEDGGIEGNVLGYIFAKVVFNSGGHQDNVFEEANNFCEWVCSFGSKDLMYLVLIDTNLNMKINSLKNKYINETNIIIANHIEFQQYIINKNSKM